MAGNINPNMIVLAREARGISQAELAGQIGMSATNLSKIERCDIGVSEEVIEVIADKTYFPPHFFRQAGDIVPENLNYRKREVVAQKLITPIHAKVNIIRKHVHFLTTAMNFAAPAIPVFEVTKKITPQEAANKLRQLWQAEASVIDDLTKLVEHNGIAVNSFPFGTDRVDSRSILTDERFPIIFLNSSLLGDRQRFSLAYELGQLVMHSFSVIPPERNVSHEANLFAAELLMPKAAIMEDFKGGISIPLLGELKRKWKVSMISLLYRADDLGLITPNQKRYLIQQFNQLKIRKREPMELDIPQEAPRLLKHWIAEFRNKAKLGTTEMSALLCLNVDEFMTLYY